MQARERISQALSGKTADIVMLVLSAIAAAVFRILMVLIIRSLLDSIFALPSSESPDLTIWAGMFAISFVIWFLLEIAVARQSVSLGSYITVSLSTAVYSSIIEAEMSELSKFRDDNLADRILKDCTKIGNTHIAKHWVSFLRDLIFLAVAFAAFMVLSPLSGLIAYAALLVYFMIVKSFSRYTERNILKAETGLQIREQHIRKSMEQIENIKLKNGILREEEEFKKHNNAYTYLNKMAVTIRTVRDSLLSPLVVGLILTLVLFLSGILLPKSQLQPGILAAFVLLIPQIYSSFHDAVSLPLSSSNIDAELTALDRFLNLKNELKSEPISSLEEISTLRFENVTYSEGNSSIEALNFELKRGETLGILASDETGTSAIFRLLTKLIHPQGGIISVNTCDINKLDTLYLREMMTAIPHRKQLFHDTIMNNIIYPLGFDDYKYNDALNRSGLKDLISEYPEKDAAIFDCETGNADIAERIVFANAFYKDSKIYVIDETASALDPKAEEALLKEFCRLKNKIVILMSDKINIVANCDKVLILENSQILEYGKVHDLQQDRNSVFFRLAQKAKSAKNTK
jgi:ABC-type multidrug transport system fused ATPase/permease subunit